jgi:hypothetical protein
MDNGDVVAEIRVPVLAGSAAFPWNLAGWLPQRVDCSEERATRIELAFSAWEAGRATSRTSRFLRSSWSEAMSAVRHTPPEPLTGYPLWPVRGPNSNGSQAAFRPSPPAGRVGPSRPVMVARLAVCHPPVEVLVEDPVDLGRNRVYSLDGFPR